VKNSIRHLTSILLGGAALLCVAPAWAQTATNNAVPEEVIVTAEMHAGTVQDTAASIAAVTGDDLADRGITSLADLAQATPGVSMKSEGPSQTEIEMRGMTSSGGNSATVGFYIDDVPLTGPAGAQNGHVIIDPSLYDLNRVEVLRGPQGTLYGASSMGGTVRLITNQPDTSGFQATAESSLSGTDGGPSLNHTENAMVNIPLSDNLALRIVGTENFTGGWIDRIVANPFPVVNYDPATTIATRGAVQDAPVEKAYPGSNAYELTSTRASVLWTPLANLTITPSFFYETSKQNGVSAYDSVPDIKDAHYQPFDIAEPLTDEITIASLNVNYSFDTFDITSSTSDWWRHSTQTQDASEEFNNPDTAATFASNNGLPPIGYYGPGGTGEEYGHEDDPSRQFSEQLRFTSTGDGPLTWVGGVYYSDFYSLWTFNGTTPNYPVYMDLGTFAPATTPNWFDANEPTSMKQVALFGDATYAITDQLKAEMGIRWNDYVYRFSACISGWGSGLGAATPSCTGLIKLNQYNVSPKFDLSYKFDDDLMAYATVSNGSRPGGGDALYPTTGGIWAPAFAAYHFSSATWPSTYQPDSVWSYELGEKSQFFNHRLTVNTSVYYEDWTNIQLEAYPNVWALNINGNYAKIYGADIDANADLGEGFRVRASAGYLHEYLNGGPHWLIAPTNVLPEVTPVNADVILSYATELTEKYALTAQLESSYTGEHYSLAFGNGYEINGQYVRLPGYDITNLRVGLQSGDGWTASLFVDNLTNTHAQLENLFQLNEASSAFNRVVTNQPLMAGVDLSYRTN
jgi:iron complex outermembrane recepter protein